MSRRRRYNVSRSGTRKIERYVAQRPRAKRLRWNDRSYSWGGV